MTIPEISSKFDIPISTLKDWRNPQNKKHKLFLFYKTVKTLITINLRLDFCNC